MKQAGLLARVGHWFKNAGRGDWDQQETPLPGGGTGEVLASDASGGSADYNGDSKPLQPMSRRKQREQTLKTLQEGFARVVGLIDAIHEHLGRQDHRTEQIARALTELAETTGRLPAAAEEQSRQLGAIAAQLEAANDRARRWEAAIRDLNLAAMADAQHQALQAIGQKLDSSGESEGRMLETLDSLRGAVSSWQETSTASTATLRGLQEAAAHRDEHLATLMTEHGRRYTWFFVVTLVLVVAAIAMGILAMLQ